MPPPTARLSTISSPSGLALPPELIHGILSHLQDTNAFGSLSQLRATCKTFYVTVTPYIYRHIICNSDSILTLFDPFLSLEDSLPLGIKDESTTSPVSNPVALQWSSDTKSRLERQFRLVRHITIISLEGDPDVDRMKLMETYLSTSPCHDQTPEKLLCNLESISWRIASEEHQERICYIAKLLRVLGDPQRISVGWMEPENTEPTFNPSDTHPDDELNSTFHTTFLQSLLIPPLPAGLILHNTPYHAIPTFNVPVPLHISIRTFPRSYFCLAEWHTPDCLGCSFQYRRRVIPQLMKAALANQQNWTIQTDTHSEPGREVLSAYQIRKIVTEIQGNSMFYLGPPLRVLFHDAEKMDRVKKWCENLMIEDEDQ